MMEKQNREHLPEVSMDDIAAAKEALDAALDQYLAAEEELLQDYQEELEEIEKPLDFEDPFIPL